MESSRCKPYSYDVSNDECAFVPPYSVLMRVDAPKRHHDARKVYNALRWIVRTGAKWRYLPIKFPPWEAVSKQNRRWIAADSFAAMIHDLRVLLRSTQGRADDLTGAILDSRTPQSTQESGARASWDGAKRRKGSKTHVAVDILGNLLALLVTPVKTNDRARSANWSGRCWR